MLGAQRDGSLKLRYAYREESVPFSKEKNSQRCVVVVVVVVDYAA